jgi:cobalt/nickel transport system permease protein
MSKNNFIERSLMSALSFFKDSIFAEEYACQKGFLQSLDPRFKMAALLLFIIQILFTKNIIILLCLYGLSLVLAYASNIRLFFFLKKTWIFIPLFSLFIAIPAMLSIVTPGEPVVTLHIGAANLIITKQGLLGATIFVLRVITSVSHVILFSLTTKHFELLKVLRTFKVPQIFVMILGMCYRYTYLFVELVENTYLAIKSRVGTTTHYKQGQHIVAWNIAYLWTRSYQLNEEVYKAMLSRGYRGEPFLLNDFKAKSRDWVWLSIVVLISLGIGYLNFWMKF